MNAFPTTRWTLVAQAKGANAQRAVAELLEAYWQALYVLARLERLSPADAQDAVQSFSVHVIEKEVFASADPARGRLRAFLKTAFKHFLSDARARTQAQKRGGHSVTVDIESAESLLTRVGRDPEQAYAKAWAQLVMQRALKRLQQEQDRFSIIERYFSGDLPPLEEVASAHAMSVPQLKSFLHRARARYRELLLEETSDTAGNAEDELGELLALVSAP